MIEPMNGTAREIAQRIYDEMQAIGKDQFGDGHRSRRARLKKRRLKELPREQLFAVKGILDNMLAAKRVGNNKAWGHDNGCFFRKRG